MMPDERLLTEMGNYNEAFVRPASARGRRPAPLFQGQASAILRHGRTVIDGPFAETKELIAGFWLWQVKSMDEAVAWLKRGPNPHIEERDVGIRPVLEAEDFGEEFTPELREQEQRLRNEMEARQKP